MKEVRAAMERSWSEWAESLVDGLHGPNLGPSELAYEDVLLLFGGELRLEMRVSEGSDKPEDVEKMSTMNSCV